MIGADLYRRLQEERRRRLDAERRLSELLASIETRRDIALRTALAECTQTKGRKTTAYHRALAKAGAFGGILTTINGPVGSGMKRAAIFDLAELRP